MSNDLTKTMQFIADYIREHDLSVNKLADRVGMSRSQMYQYIRGDQQPSIERVHAILDAMDHELLIKQKESELNDC